MTLDEIRASMTQAGVTISVTRPSWNKKYLEFWLELTSRTHIITSFEVLFSKKNKCTVGELEVRVSETPMCKCRDGDIIPYSFKLDEEDHCADDWVII